MLTALGYDCNGIDGDFGNGTLSALKNFQKANGLTVDGIYGSVSRSTLEILYKKLTTQTNAQKTWINAVANVADMARVNKWIYGDSRSTRPCDDGKISCDRIVARALYDLGFTNQPTGGITCGHMESYLPKFGFNKVTKTSQIKPGAVIAVRYKEHSYIDHVFVVKSYNDKTGICVKYDTGSNQRIQSQQPFTTQLLEWGANRIFVAAWNVPDKLDPSSSSASGWSATGTATAKIDNLNVRKTPDSKGEVIRKVNKGNRFEVDGNIVGNWVHVNVAGIIGYIHKKYVVYD